MKVLLVFILVAILTYCIRMILEINFKNLAYKIKERRIKGLQESFVKFIRKHEKMLLVESCFLDSYFRTNDVDVYFNGVSWTDMEFSNNHDWSYIENEINWVSMFLDEKKFYPTYVHMNKFVWGPIMDTKELRQYLLKLGYYFRALSEANQVDISKEFEEIFKELRCISLSFGEIVVESELLKEQITFIKH